MKNTKPKDSVLLTAEGLKNLQSELNELKNARLPQVVERVARARDEGDISENSAYQFGKQEQEFLEGRIMELAEILLLAKAVVNTPAGKKTAVDIGCKVTVSVSGKEQIFHVVGDWEAKPAESKISGSSPLGKALLGKKIGEKVAVEAPVGKVIYTILSIE